jgi:uncharacterized membrane protein YeiH
MTVNINLIFDLFCATFFSYQGALKAFALDKNLLIIIFSAALTAFGGGIIRDMVFFKHFYILQNIHIVCASVFIGITLVIYK